MIGRASFLASYLSYAASFVPLTTRRFGPQRGLSMTRVSDECANLLNQQVTREFESCQLYMSACIWCHEQDLEGMAAYMLQESDEERSHALRIIDFAQKRDIPLKLDALPAPRADWKNALDLWSDILQAEKDNTNSLYLLADLAQDCREHALMAFLIPFHEEQYESEDHLETITAKVKDESKTPGLIRQLDKELGDGVKAKLAGKTI
mmetsp:Transcript_30456/g.61994  ORF Transcript_30456/g.61994 Transcript_30456/m.61994 type:complete len:207 (+) Transcript_30456:213-833(+)